MDGAINGLKKTGLNHLAMFFLCVVRGRKGENSTNLIKIKIKSNREKNKMCFCGCCACCLALLGIGGGAAVVASQNDKPSSHHHQPTEKQPLMQPPMQQPPPPAYLPMRAAPPPPPAGGTLAPTRAAPPPPQFCLGCSAPTNGKRVNCNLNHTFIVCDVCYGDPSNRLAGCPHPEHRGVTTWTKPWTFF